jgi:hypothetical protein
MSSQLSLPFSYLHQNPIRIPHLPHSCYIPCPSHHIHTYLTWRYINSSLDVASQSSSIRSRTRRVANSEAWASMVELSLCWAMQVNLLCNFVYRWF